MTSSSPAAATASRWCRAAPGPGSPGVLNAELRSAAATLDLLRRVKAAFEPDGIMNPGAVWV